jgi:hypothetical protein
MRLAKILFSVVSASAVVLGISATNDGHDTSGAVVYHGMGYNAGIAVVEHGVSNGPSAIMSKSISSALGHLMAMLSEPYGKLL